MQRVTLRAQGCQRGAAVQDLGPGVLVEDAVSHSNIESPTARGLHRGMYTSTALPST